MTASPRARFIWRIASVYACLYLLGTLALHVARLAHQGKPLTVGLRTYLAVDVVAAVLCGYFVGWLAWRQSERRQRQAATRPR